MEAKIRPWLLWTLIGVILIGGGFLFWYFSKNKSSGTTATTSPTATKSAAVSPGTTPTATKSSSTTGGTGSQTAAPSSTSTPTVETKNSEESIPFRSPSSLICNLTVSFKYPTDFSVRRTGGTPMVGGAAWLEIYQSNAKSIFVSNSSADVNTDYSPVTCATPDYENLADYATRENISNYSSLTINSLSAIQYTLYDQKVTAIQNSNKKVVTVYAEIDSSNSAAYDIIINSISFN